MSTASHLRQLLADIDAKRENARALIRDLQAELTRLDAERKPIADALRSVIYPIVDLAPELTLEIFAYYAAGGYDPVILTHVCRSWRQIALMAAKLWSQIVVDSSTQSSIDGDKLLHRRFERAGECFIDVKTTSKRGPCADPRVYSIISGHSHQIRSLEYEIPLPKQCRFEGMTGHIPHLESIHLAVSAARIRTPYLREAPALCKLTIDVSKPEFSLLELVFPFQQITFLCVSTPCQDVLLFIALFPRLQFLEFCSWDLALPTNQIVLNYLRTLRIRDGAPRLLLGWLRILEVPALEALAIDLQRAAIPECTQNLGTFLASKERLRSMELSNLSGATAVDIVTLTPNLISLKLDRLTDQADLFQALVPDIFEPLLPGLVELSVTTPPVEESDLRVLDFLHSRAVAGEALRRFSFTSSQRQGWFSDSDFQRRVESLPFTVDIRTPSGGQALQEPPILYSLLD
ncbi:hypothetical protein HMN09_01178100 [Mycena chlorophos]|uniref:F-box domain-containing protein n=1 Tax=Mycena chlorophos TaxID=658473 RepID=A0A8H6VTY0_MYCCL|nr:hypothetical protein HMN09_01178100 [Mycena chlorophos]